MFIVDQDLKAALQKVYMMNAHARITSASKQSAGYWSVHFVIDSQAPNPESVRQRRDYLRVVGLDCKENKATPLEWLNAPVAMRALEKIWVPYIKRPRQS